MIPLHEIIAKAKLLGIEGAEAMERAELIRAIQIKEGHSPCYGTNWCKPEWKEACIWKDECDSKIFTQ
ncbi:MAG TPA: Rho termination factor N-terminal domain-containing protein [Mariprofundaceae bacterium]|nr:Rho termination factor N-terminal domain-containing protein [Mariprofundaceae bacterium]